MQSVHYLKDQEMWWSENKFSRAFLCSVDWLLINEKEISQGVEPKELQMICMYLLSYIVWGGYYEVGGHWDITSMSI